MAKPKKKNTLAAKKARGEKPPKTSKYAKKQPPIERNEDATQTTD